MSAGRFLQGSPQALSKELRSALLGLLPRLTRFGVSLTGSRADGDEVVQAACERALARGIQLRAIDRLDAWMYRIMRNVWVDKVRPRQAGHREPMAALTGGTGADDVGAADRAPSLGAVRRALNDLPQEQRTVLMLVCVDGLGYRQAAAVLGVPIETVMSRLARGRQDLHRKLELGTADQHGHAAAAESPQARSSRPS